MDQERQRNHDGGRFYFRCGDPSHFLTVVGMRLSVSPTTSSGTALSHALATTGWRREEPSDSGVVASLKMDNDFLQISYDDGVAKEVWCLCNHVIVKVTEGFASAVEISMRLGEWWGSDWHWEVRKLNEDGFLVAFPSSASLTEVVSEGGQTLFGPFSLSFAHWSPSIGAVSRRWKFRVSLQVQGLPAHGRSKGSMEKLLRGFGALVNYDNNQDDVLVSLLCDNPDSLPQEVTVLFGNFFYLVRFLVLEVSSSPPSSIAPSPERQGSDNGAHNLLRDRSPWIPGLGYDECFLDGEVDMVEGQPIAGGGACGGEAQPGGLNRVAESTQ